MTPAAGPVVLVADSELQERPIPDEAHPRVPKLTLASPPQGDSGAVDEIEAVARRMTEAQRAVARERGTRLARLSQAARDRARADAAYAWNAVPISTARLAAEVWEQIRNEDWSLVNGALSGWPQRLWNFEKHYQFIGTSGRASTSRRLRRAWASTPRVPSRIRTTSPGPSGGPSRSSNEGSPPSSTC